MRRARLPGMHASPRLLVLYGAFLAAALGGCGHLGADHQGFRVEAVEPLPDAGIMRYPAASPQRVALEWYQALQRRDVGLARHLLARGAAPPPQRFERLLRRARPFLRRVALGPVSDVVVHRDWATVFTELRVRWVAPNGRVKELRTPQSLTLRRGRDGAWRLSDAYLLRFAHNFPFREPSRPS
jgi:hypothetical protein